MALQVWLPLNKQNDARNQGLSNAVASNLSYSASGKLGGCYAANGTICNWGSGHTSNGVTVAFWHKWKGAVPTGWVTTLQFPYSGGDRRYYLATNNGHFYPAYREAGYETKFTLDDKWHHITMAVSDNGTSLSIYIDGILDGAIMGRSGFQLGGDLYMDQCYINDLRIYDHCLSPKEVKEIAKGLVLHYPLNDRYIENTTNLFGNISTSWEGFRMQKYPTDSANTPYIDNNGDLVLLGNGSGKQSYITSESYIGWTNVKPNTTYTLSTYAYLGTGASYIMYFYEQGDNASTSVTAKAFTGNNEWRLCSITVTTKSTTTRMYCELNNGTSSILNSILILKSCSLQLEEKDHATPYTPNTRNETTVYDCSGYQNNGTITGALSCSADSPRYKISTETSSSRKVQKSAFLPSAITHYTISVWCKITDPNAAANLWTKHSNGSKGIVDGFGVGSIYSYNGGGLLTSTSFLNTSETIAMVYPNFGQNYKDGNWHMYTIVGNGNTNICYLDGLKTNSSTLSNFVSYYINGTLSIGYTETCLVSDFRMYATALSAEDIKELYNTSAYVSDNGTLLTYSVEE